MNHPALFIDRDGTLVHPRHYPSHPDDLVLYDGIADGLRRLQTAGFKLVVITNQSGIARGYFTEDALSQMHDHLARALAEYGVRIDGIYFCPHHVDGSVPHLSIACECRKPQPGMLLRAAEEMSLDLRRSWFLGDILDDVEAGNRVGCRTVLVDLGTEAPPTNPLRSPDYVACNTVHALSIVESVERLGPTTALDYRPYAWAVTGELVGAASRQPDLRAVDAGN